MTAVIASPATGSPHSRPAATAASQASAPSTGASNQEWRAPATSVAELMRLPTTSSVARYRQVAGDRPGDTFNEVVEPCMSSLRMLS